MVVAEHVDFESIVLSHGLLFQDSLTEESPTIQPESCPRRIDAHVYEEWYNPFNAQCRKE